MSHVAPDSFGDLDAAAADEHVIGCVLCRTELAAQQQVRAALTGSAAPGPLPDDVATRLDAALGALPAFTAPVPQTVPQTVPPEAAAEAAGYATVLPLDVERARRRPRRPWLAAAAAVLVMGAGGYVVHDLAPKGRSASGAKASLEAHASPAPGGAALNESLLVSSGTSYSRTGLAHQVDAALLRRVAPLSGGSAAARSVSVTQCLQGIEAGDAAPLLADAALFEGKPALILVLRTTVGVREVWVVDRSCRPGREGLLYYVRLR